MGTPNTTVTIDEQLENIFDAGFQCSTNEFNQEKFRDSNWALNQGIWDFHIEWRKFIRSKDGKRLMSIINARIADAINRAYHEGHEDGYNKGNNQNDLKQRIQAILNDGGGAYDPYDEDDY